jgi:hypothetical protein
MFGIIASVLFLISVCRPPPLGPTWDKGIIYYDVLDQSLRPHVERAAKVWSSPGIRFVYKRGSANRIHYGWLPSRKGGSTVIISNEGRVRWFDITISNKLNRYDLDEVLVHELGHALGLGHANCPDSVMNSIAPSSSLYPGDIIARDSLYPPKFRIFLPIAKRK